MSEVKSAKKSMLSEMPKQRNPVVSQIANAIYDKITESLEIEFKKHYDNEHACNIAALELTSHLINDSEIINNVAQVYQNLLEGQYDPGSKKY